MISPKPLVFTFDKYLKGSCKRDPDKIAQLSSLTEFADRNIVTSLTRPRLTASLSLCLTSCLRAAPLWYWWWWWSLGALGWPFRCRPRHHYHTRTQQTFIKSQMLTTQRSLSSSRLCGQVDISCVFLKLCMLWEGQQFCMCSLYSCFQLYFMQ